MTSDDLTYDATGSLGLQVTLDAAAATITPRGDIDVVTSPSLLGVLNALIEDGYREIATDLGEVTFIDASGIAALTEIAQRLIGAGGVLTVRSPSTFTCRLLGITHLDDLVVFEPSTVAGSAAGTVGQHGLVRSSTDVVDAALRLVTSLAKATVANADGVSVTLERHGRLMTVAASNDAVLTMDRHQYETGEGPCLDAKSQGRHFYTGSLASETRWPHFSPRALEQGIQSILSSPLVARDRTHGALNIYSSTAQAFGDSDQGLAALFAEQAGEILTTASRDVTDEASNERFVASLQARRTIHQAQGVLMARHSLPAEAAIAKLFQDARAADVAVRELAAIVVASVGEDGKA